MKSAISFLLFAFASISCQNIDVSKIKILPLHPYSSSPSFYDSTSLPKNNFIDKYYFIQGAYKATDELSDIVDAFIISFVKNDSVDFNKYGGYYIFLYKETSQINKSFREKIDGVFTNTLDDHKDDLLFRYKWENQKFISCEYYQNGKVIKILYSKKAALFKQSLSPSLIQEFEKQKVTVKDVPVENK